MNFTIEQAKGLLDFNQKLDIALLDAVVSCMYTGEGQQQRLAQELLTTLKDHNQSWTRVDTILKLSTNMQTKYFALQILENLIKYRWRVISRANCDGIRCFIVALIIETSSKPEVPAEMKIFLNKLNVILVQILKKEWPKNWPNFISELVGSSQSSEILCQNNMVILKLLSEEIFDFSSGEMTQAKAKHLKDNMCSEFAQVFQLCQNVLENSFNPSLVLSTLETLHKFLNWIPKGFIFETTLINTLIFKFLNVPMFRNVTLNCLTEIASISSPEHDEMFIVLIVRTMAQIEQILPKTAIIKSAYENGQDNEQKFIHNLSLFLSSFLKEHGKLIEARSDLQGTLTHCVQLLLQISEVEETEIFKICLEYWNVLTEDLYKEMPSLARNALINEKHKFYHPVLTHLRSIVIGRMAKPEEVLVVENDQGEVVREFLKDTNAIELYTNMRETLVYLTHLDKADTERIFKVTLDDQMKETGFSWKTLNTVCWAIGSVSGTMEVEDEKRFLITVIKTLLNLCESKRGKNNKAIVASNLMYVIGQYPRFLAAHWKFLSVLVNKLFEFMHETHTGIQDMACDTFYKIAKKCGHHLVAVKPGERMPFVEDILNNIGTIITDLQPQQIHVFYEIVGSIINMQSNKEARENLIEKLMYFPNHAWDGIIREATYNVEILKNQDKLKQLVIILKTNARVCKTLGHSFVVQLQRIYLDMLNLYKIMTENINAEIAKSGEAVTKQSLVRSMRTIRKEILNIISGWIKRSKDTQIVLDNFIVSLLDVVLQDYQQCSFAIAREPEVLSTMTIIATRLGRHISKEIPRIFESLFECTLDMINKDFEVFPEHRLNLFLFLQTTINHCFESIISMQSKFKMVLDSIIWAIKHTMRNISDTGLDILYQLLQSIWKINDGQGFYQLYYIEILDHLFNVVTDTSHTAGLTMQSTILAYMFELIDTSKITLPLNQQPGSNQSNVIFVKEHTTNLLKRAFPNSLKDAQVNITVQGFFNLYLDILAFKEHLRDFLIQIREFSGEDDSDLFLEEREAVLRKAEEEKLAFQKSVPGILNPHVEDMMYI